MGLIPKGKKLNHKWSVMPQNRQQHINTLLLSDKLRDQNRNGDKTVKIPLQIKYCDNGDSKNISVTVRYTFCSIFLNNYHIPINSFRD